MKHVFSFKQVDCGHRRTLLALPLPAPITAPWGQVAPQAGTADSIEEIVVTGWRISRTGFDAPAPPRPGARMQWPA